MRKLHLLTTVLFFTLSLSTTCYLLSAACLPQANAQEESFTLTTYYPSPYGSYSELQLSPHSAPSAACNANARGTLYYDSDDDQVYNCNGTAWGIYGGFWRGSGDNIYNTNTGNVGIGTTSPRAKLAVVDTSYSYSWPTPGLYTIDTNGRGHFVNSNPAAAPPSMFPPKETDFALRLDSMGSTAENDLRFAKGGQDLAAIQVNGNIIGAYGDDFEIFVKKNGVTWMRAMTFDNPTGNVGIKISDPVYDLHVNGSIGANSMDVQTITADTVRYKNLQPRGKPSDERLKKNIKTIEKALDKVKKLRGVSFEWKDQQKYAKGRQLGLIAQEVDKVAPEVVDKSEQYYSLATDNLVPLLIEAIKDQQKEIDALRGDLDRLKKSRQK